MGEELITHKKHPQYKEIHKQVAKHLKIINPPKVKNYYPKKGEEFIVADIETESLNRNTPVGYKGWIRKWGSPEKVLVEVVQVKVGVVTHFKCRVLSRRISYI